MTVSYVEILGYDGENRPIFPLTRATRDALAKFVALEAPTGRRKWAQAQWNLTADEARAVCEATASASTIDKIWKHPNGGWAVAIPVLGAVIGHSLDDHIQARRKRHAEIARRHGALRRDLRAVLAPGDPGPGRVGAGAAEPRRHHSR